MTLDVQTIDSGTRPPAGGAARGMWLFVAIALLVGGVLQCVAAAQRWIFADPVVVADRTVEDHLFDYVLASEPWVPLGQTALLFGLGQLLVAAALVASAMALWRERAPKVVLIPAAVVAVVASGLTGAHALLSGATGVPSPLVEVVAVHGALVLGIVHAAALVMLAVLAGRRSLLRAAGIALLLGTTALGYVFALFGVAPFLVGYQSHDTTPWTEGVVAASVLLAGAFVLAGRLRRG